MSPSNWPTLRLSSLTTDQNSSCTSQHTNLQRSAPVHCDATPPQLIMPLTEALRKTRPVLVPHLAAHYLQSRAPAQRDATTLPPVMPAEHRVAEGKARQGKARQGKARQGLHPAAPQLQFTLAEDLHTPTDCSTA
jgi:hypothetical protein